MRWPPHIRVTDSLENKNKIMAVTNLDALTLGGALIVGGAATITGNLTVSGTITGDIDISATLAFDDGEGIVDTNAAELLTFSVTASAVNEFTIANAATGSGPVFSATGGDAKHRHASRA